MTNSAMDRAAVAQVLAGRGSYDDLDDPEQAVVREAWSHRMTQLRDQLDLAAEFAAAGEQYSEADASGKVTTTPPQ